MTRRKIWSGGYETIIKGMMNHKTNTIKSYKPHSILVKYTNPIK